MLPKPYRLRKSKDFQSVREKGRRAYARSLVFSWSANRLAYSRFGFIASKKVGNAVARHRAVRLLRESVRHQLGRIKPGFDFVIVARRGIQYYQQAKVEAELLAKLQEFGLLVD